MTREQIKQALISVLIGAITIFLVNFLEGVLGILNHWIADGTGGAVAMSRYIAKVNHYL